MTKKPQPDCKVWNKHETLNHHSDVGDIIYSMLSSRKVLVLEDQFASPCLVLGSDLKSLSLNESPWTTKSSKIVDRVLHIMQTVCYI